MSNLSSPDLKKDNIYLKGGNSIAEALLIGRADNSNSNGAAGSNSIAMRMKRNREA
jgi:hypothetical protein